MKTFQITQSAKEKFRMMNLRVVQGAIAMLADRKRGISRPPQGIYKVEGGVLCADKEIAIMRGYVKDDWRISREGETAEEIAVAEAIEEVARRVEAGDNLAEFPAVDRGNQLMCLVQ